MSNMNYTTEPIKDEFNKYYGKSILTNSVQTKSTSAIDGLYLYVNPDDIKFYYKTNGKYNGPQRFFSGDGGFVKEFY